MTHNIVFDLKQARDFCCQEYPNPQEQADYIVKRGRPNSLPHWDWWQE